MPEKKFPQLMQSYNAGAVTAVCHIYCSGCKCILKCPEIGQWGRVLCQSQSADNTKDISILLFMNKFERKIYNRIGFVGKQLQINQ